MAVAAHPALPQVCAPIVQEARRHFAEAQAIMAREPRRTTRAPRLMGAVYGAVLEATAKRGFVAPRARVRKPKLKLLIRARPSRPLLMKGTIHVVGAGLAGLAAALKLAAGGRRVVLHEASRHAGGRCRSYHDPALGMVIDNGNHLVLSGNVAVADYVAAIGASDRLKPTAATPPSTSPTSPPAPAGR